MPSLKSLLIFITASAAMAVAPSHETGLAAVQQATATTTRIPHMTPRPTAKPTTSIKCDYAYCAEGTSWCFYFAGFTTYDTSRGPLPGETRTSLGPCGTKAAEADVKTVEFQA